MRRVIPLLLGALVLATAGCPGPAEPNRPTASPRPRTTPQRARPRPRPPVRKAMRPRPRPKGWGAQLLGRASAGTGRIVGLAAAGSTVVSATRGPKGTFLHGWDPSTRKARWTLKAPARRVELGLSADGKSMVVTTPGGTNHIYRLSGGKPKIYRKWKRKRGRNKGRSQGLSADGSMLIRGDVRGQVRGYALEKYKMKWLVKGERVFISRDGKTVAVIRGKHLQLYDAVTGRKVGVQVEAKDAWVAVALPSTKPWGAWLAQGSGKCALWGGGLKPRAIVCLRGLQLSGSPGAKLMGIAGVGEARVVRSSGGQVVTNHKSQSKAPLRVVFPSDATFVVANETEGQLSFYRLVRR